MSFKDWLFNKQVKDLEKAVHKLQVQYDKLIGSVALLELELDALKIKPRTINKPKVTRGDNGL